MAENEKSPVAGCDRALSELFYILHIHIRALLPYDCRSCNRRHQYVFTNIVLIVFFVFNGGKYNHIVLIAKANLAFFVYFPSFSAFVT